jgi:hypothetical protein
VYALIHGFGTFYCSLLEKCQLVDGKRKMGPSYFPEIGKYDEFNVCYDITYVTAGLDHFDRAAATKAFTASVSESLHQSATISQGGSAGRSFRSFRRDQVMPLTLLGRRLNSWPPSNSRHQACPAVMFAADAGLPTDGGE